VLAHRHGGAQVGVARRDDGQIGGQHQVQARRRLEERPKVRGGERGRRMCQDVPPQIWDARRTPAGPEEILSADRARDLRRAATITVRTLRSMEIAAARAPTAGLLLLQTLWRRKQRSSRGVALRRRRRVVKSDEWATLLRQNRTPASPFFGEGLPGDVIGRADGWWFPVTTYRRREEK
jgi:hypothetical protein